MSRAETPGPWDSAIELRLRWPRSDRFGTPWLSKEVSPFCWGYLIRVGIIVNASRCPPRPEVAESHRMAGQAKVQISIEFDWFLGVIFFRFFGGI